MTPAGSDPVNALPLADLRRVVSALAAQVATLHGAVDRLTTENAALKGENLALKDEIARLKGLPPRPKFKVKPSGMEQATSKPPASPARFTVRIFVCGGHNGLKEVLDGTTQSSPHP